MSDVIISPPLPPTLICGNYCTVYLNEKRSITCCGLNEYCKLGDEEHDKIIFPPVSLSSLCNIKSIACGRNHTICTNFDGLVYSFGSNKDGQLGVSNKIQKTHIPQLVDLPPINYVSCGEYFTICVTYDGLLYSFGRNDNGQLGLGHANVINSISIIPELNDIELIDCGMSFVICKTTAGNVYSWGNNKSGQHGSGISCDDIIKTSLPTKMIYYPENIVSIKCGDNFAACLTVHGELFTHGSNGCGQLGYTSINKVFECKPKKVDIVPIQRMECGSEHVLCIDLLNKLWVFGGNFSGQLGLGDNRKRNTPTLNECSEISEIIDISSKGPRSFFKTTCIP